MSAGRDRRGEKPGRASNSYQEVDDFKLWGVFIFSLIGATATTFAVVKTERALHYISKVGFRLTRSSRKGAPSSSYRSNFQEGASKRCARQRKEEYEEEMERVERIRRVQSVFNRERNKYNKSYESWTDNGSGAYNQHFQRDDWYWKIDPSYKDHRTNYMETPSNSVSYSLSRHYLVLGLDRSRTRPYTDSEIKIAFQAKAKQCHPDQNQDNKEVAEAKFKEVMESYRAIRLERKGKPP